MKIYYFIAGVFVLLSCTNATPTDTGVKQEIVLDNKIPVKDSIKERTRLIAYGDFNGDKIIDTLKEEIIIESRDRWENPFYNKWDKDKYIGLAEVPRVILVSSNSSIDTCFTDVGIGLYCLFNIGDNNADGKDELALVVEYTDGKNLNYCQIFSICDKRWQNIRDISIDENVFGKNKEIVFNDIPSFLEQKNGTWMYLDYTRSIEDTTGKYSTMRKLKVHVCY